MLPSIPRLEDYDVSAENGFLPTEVPLERLPNPYYKPWEAIVKNLQALILIQMFKVNSQSQTLNIICFVQV